MFQCKKLEDTRISQKEIESFTCDRNENMADFFYASKELERDGFYKTYVVLFNKNIPQLNLKKGEIVAYFTLSAHGFLVEEEQLNEMSEVETSLVKYPCIEISQLAVNSQFIKKFTMKGKKPPQRLGIYIFDTYILPIVHTVEQYIGVKYICLYAADSSEKKTLIKYYQSWGFEIPDINLYQYISHTPRYDRGCQFMYYKLHSE